VKIIHKTKKKKRGKKDELLGCRKTYMVAALNYEKNGEDDKTHGQKGGSENQTTNDERAKYERISKHHSDNP